MAPELSLAPINSDQTISKNRICFSYLIGTTEDMPDELKQIIKSFILGHSKIFTFTESAPNKVRFEINLDRASLSDPEDRVGGIDMNSANLAMTIKRDGKGIPLPLARQDMAQLSRIQGFIPVIIEIKPAATLPVFSEL